MKLKTWRAVKKSMSGFTLIELLVVVLIIGILAAIAVPQYFKVVEKGRFSEATSCFSTIKGAQERYYLKFNSYTQNPAVLDVSCPAMKAFNAITLTGADTAAYTGTVTRNQTVQTYGAYVVTYVGPTGTITCSQSNCTNDLLPN